MYIVPNMFLPVNQSAYLLSTNPLYNNRFVCVTGGKKHLPVCDDQRRTLDVQDSSMGESGRTRRQWQE